MQIYEDMEDGVTDKTIAYLRLCMIMIWIAVTLRPFWFPQIITYVNTVKQKAKSNLECLPEYKLININTHSIPSCHKLYRNWLPIIRI